MAVNLIQGTENPDIILGTFGNDEIVGLGGNDTILGTVGSDIIDGGSGIDTINYDSGNLFNKIILLPRGFLDNGSSRDSQIISIERIVAPAGFDNEINASSGRGGVSLDVDLGANRLIVNNVPEIGTQTFTVENFVNVRGTPQSDILIGDEADNKLIGVGGNDSLVGSGGNDTLRGGRGNDTLTGTDSVFRGVGERDILVGEGLGTDIFILGDENGSFYQAKGNGDLAVIRNFDFGETIQLGANETYDLENDSFGFRVFLTTDSQRDLIANVRFPVFSIDNSASVSSTPQALSPTSLQADALIGEVPEEEFTIASSEMIGNMFIGA